VARTGTTTIPTQAKLNQKCVAIPSRKFILASVPGQLPAIKMLRNNTLARNAKRIAELRRVRAFRLAVLSGAAMKELVEKILSVLFPVELTQIERMKRLQCPNYKDINAMIRTVAQMQRE
jgi:hypothetical protein